MNIQKLEDTKEVMRSRKSKNRTYNGINCVSDLNTNTDRDAVMYFA
jgi:hypothetical protein